ncbi:MAG: SufD family Fe-S cluster assembly protein [Pseudomonadota bacterium]
MALTTVTTDAERTLSAMFERRSADFSSAPLDRARADAFQRFSAAGLPHRRVEAYKYTDLKSKLRTLPEPAGEVSEADIEAALGAHPPFTTDAHRVVIANGRLIEERSSVPEGVRLSSILSSGADTEDVGALVADNDDPLTLANISLFEGGAVLHVDGEAGAPVEIVHVLPNGALAMGRVAIFVAPGMGASIIERFLCPADGVANNLAEITVGAGARLSVVRIAEDHSTGYSSFSNHHITVAETSQLEHLTVSTGLGLTRNQVFCAVRGDDAEANFRAATVAVGARHVDNTLVMRHDALHSRSSEVFRSAVGDGGISIVQGRIIVDPGAQKTDAKMMSNALFLDDSGEVVNKPELEIFADDVQCGHGATSGDLDEDPVFYLRARGIPEAVARRLLVEAFLVDALDRVEDDALRDGLADSLRAALAKNLGGASDAVGLRKAG